MMNEVQYSKVDEDIEFREALTEVSEVLKYTDEDVVNQIPKSFIRFIEENKDKDYAFNIDENKTLENQNLKQSTREIIALIYRSYIATPEEKEEFKIKDREEQRRIEEEKAKKYDPNNIFKNDNNLSESNSNVNSKENNTINSPKDSDSIFDHDKDEINKEQGNNLNTSLVVQDESFIGKIIYKIKNIIRNLFKKK